MLRKIYVFCSKKGYLSDINKYTDDPLSAISFSDYDVATKRLLAAKKLLKEDCRVVSVEIPFPRPRGWHVIPT